MQGLQYAVDACIVQLRKLIGCGKLYLPVFEELVSKTSYIQSDMLLILAIDIWQL